jgi:hypothetical protein
MFKFNTRRLTGSWKGATPRDFAAVFEGGYMDGTFLEAKYNGPRVSEHEGADGTVTVVLNASSLAQATITLSQGNPLNEYLSFLIADAKRDYFPVGAFDFADLNGTTKVKAPKSYIKESAPVLFGNQVQGRAWIFGLVEATIIAGAGEQL